jgi:nicotinate phosphoribosyltransferase
MSRTLLTDFYQITMAYSYWKANMHNHEAVFHLFYRKNPFKGNFSIAAGLQPAIDFIKSFRFTSQDIRYLKGLSYPNGKPLFEQAFLDYLRDLPMEATIHAIPEGTVVFPHEPLLRIQANIVICQLLETPLLNILNFQTLIATKAARVCMAAEGDTVVEFGLRRAQGNDGAIAASRAAFIGGCAATSNVLAGQLFNIPVRGTHAHSWVMSFGDEAAAFEAYTQAMPENSTLLVDTYDTLEGVRHAIAAGEQLRKQGHDLVGIRLDSGDLAQLSKDARNMLDAAGFQHTKIVATNDLDEYAILDLKSKGACIDTWGVGTKLVTAYDQPALGGVYKLGAIRKKGEEWQYRMKLSEEMVKVSNPGILQVRRFYNAQQESIADMIYNEEIPSSKDTLVPFDQSSPIVLAHHSFQDLLVPIFQGGKYVYRAPSLPQIQTRAQKQLATLPASIRSFHPATYSSGLESSLHTFKSALMQALKK